MASKRARRQFLITTIAFAVALLLLMGGQAASKSAVESTPTKETLHEAPLKTTQTPKTPAAQLQAYLANQLDTFGITMRPGSEHRADSHPTPQTEARCKSIIDKTLLSLPPGHRQQLKSLTLFYTNDGRRGLGGNGGIIIRCLNVGDQELSSVMTHEIGHLVDASLLTGVNTQTPSGFYDFSTPVLIDDPSLIFYRISWDSDTSMKQTANGLDFVSRYAMTDPFEDFAETYAYFRWHGPEFRLIALYNPALALKYDFMKNYVFHGQEFGTNVVINQKSLDVTARNYDVTVLPILYQAQ